MDGKCSLMAIDAVSRQSTGSVLNSGAVALFSPVYLLRFEMPPTARPMLSKVSLMGLSYATLRVIGRTVSVWVYLFSLFHCMDSSHPSIGRASLIMRQSKPQLPIRPQNYV